ncbi:MAG TPA: dienelactone hydrolase family protein [Trebonia sp.]|jgi:carboxymethylenebutenolidase|nr:dienelactone hydrolase family protein [Trebonia sp.]
MPHTDVQIPTSDGVSSGTLHVPDGTGPWPGVLVFTDAFGPRDTFTAMGDRLAGLGYVALIPDVYYREAGYPPFDVRTAFSDEGERNRIFGLIRTLTNERVIADADAYADFLLARPEVRGSAIGAHGYCMGGRLTLVAAGGIGGKLKAAASFHAAGVAVPGDPSSPHLAADKIRAAVFVAGSVEDAGFTAEQAALLEQSLAAAGVPSTVEIWPGHHGFAVPDQAVYDEALAERHWEALRGLYAAQLA